MVFVALFLGLAAACAGLPHQKILNDGRIVGGVNARIEDYPYQLSFQRSNRHTCGASIVDDQWALTAAHCVEGTLDDWSVRANSSVRGSGGTVYKVIDKIQHELYGGEVPDYDLALLKVETPFVFGSGVARIGLPDDKEEVAPGTVTKVTGWGTLTPGGILPSTLQAVEVPVLGQSDCQKAYRPSATITPRMICAGHKRGGKDACQGDSGGPMVAEDKLVGVVSWGYGCANPQYPGVYSRVSEMRSWVKEQCGV